MSNKYCFNCQDTVLLTEIVKQSYEATKHEIALKMAFMPIEIVSSDATGAYVRVPGAKYQWYLPQQQLDALEMIGDETMTSIGAELWRIKRSMEMLKRQMSTPTPMSVMPIIPSVPITVVSAATLTPMIEKPKRQKKESETYIWPEQQVTGIRVIKTYADGSQVLDDGKERWINASWSQPVKYVCR